MITLLLVELFGVVEAGYFNVHCGKRAAYSVALFFLRLENGGCVASRSSMPTVEPFVSVARCFLSSETMWSTLISEPLVPRTNFTPLLRRASL